MKRFKWVVVVAFLVALAPSLMEARGWPWKRHKVEEVTVESEQAKALRGPSVDPDRKSQEREDAEQVVTSKDGKVPPGKPVERQMTRGGSTRIDLRKLPRTPPRRRDRPEREGPLPNPTIAGEGVLAASESEGLIAVPEAAAPAATLQFDGLDRENWGAGSPPDTTGDVGPVYFIQAVNTSVGIYRKSDGFQEAAFTFDTLMNQGSFGNQCDTENFGDPIVLYDSFEDRWILTDFAFTLDGSGNVSPPEAFQCFAVSMSGNPLTGGWNFYSIRVTDGLNDYPKLGVWTDGIYMSANMFGFASGASFAGTRVWALNKQQMYAGSPTVQIVEFSQGTGDFTLMPSNARLQTGTPPAGTPNYFVSTWNFTNAVSVYKFAVDWNRVSLSTFTGPDVPISATSWPNASVANVPQSGTAMLLDALQIRAMFSNQYSNIGGAESLWVSHTVRRGNTTGFAAPRWYQVNVTGGTVAASIPQAATWDPDGANVLHRWMSSLAVDRAGNMALGYSTSSSTTFPSIAYAGRLASDPVNTFSQTEQVLFAGTASQTGTSRWGDYSTMTLDPDGCSFWFTTEYANPVSQSFDKRWKTRIGTFTYPSCTPVGAGGTLSGTVTATTGGTPITGATVVLGSRTTVTNGSGAYSFMGLPAGTYASETASMPGFVTASASNLVITDGGTTTQDFSLATAATSGCPVDTTQLDFQTGTTTNADLTASAGNVVLLNADAINQQNTTLGTSGVGITVTTYGGQTFTPSISGNITRVDINLFCSGCSGTTPNLTLSIRATAAGLPTGADLASATITGFSSGASGYYVATFGTPFAVTSGTMYALVVRPTTNPSPGTYALTRSGTSTAGADVYAGGTRVSGATSGTVWSIPLTGTPTGVSTDAGFKVYMNTGYATTGDFVSRTIDSNPVAGLTPIWSTLSWNATTPANTSLSLQVAGSNSASGPFNFVGPDGTASTYFTTSGASLSQFYGLRYLKYKAFLATTDTTATPTLSDVTICFSDVDCSAAATVTPSSATACPSSTGNTASGPAGATSYSWGITGGTITGGQTSQTVTYTAGASGTVALTLDIVEAGGCRKSGTANVTIVSTPTPTITPGGPTTFCAGDSVTLSSSSASGNQWYLNGNPIALATSQTYMATASGDYTVVVTTSGCPSPASSPTTVTVNPTPVTPTITSGGPTTFCAGGSVTLSSSSASGNQWYLNGNPIALATSQAYMATASGDYTVVVTTLGCPSAPSSATTVTVNPIPATPTITPGGPTTFCAGDSVTLSSSSASGNQWYLNGNPIALATSQTYVATAVGDYTVVVTTSGCPSPASSATTVAVNALPNPSITTSASVPAGSSSTASVADAGVGATYSWNITNGSITAGSGTSSITFTAGSVGPLTLGVTVTASTGCGDTGSANVTVGPSAVTVTSVNPTVGNIGGGTAVTIGGTGFLSGATVTFGGSAATGVTVVNATTITATTPAHAAGAVNVTVTNPDTGNGTLTNGFTYQQRFDPNGDNVIDPADIFYLINYLYLGGPAPMGVAGMVSGDANGDGIVDPADIFYTVNFLFSGGQQPFATLPSDATSRTTGRTTTLNGNVTLGAPARRGARWAVPVVVTMAPGSATPQAISLNVKIDGRSARPEVRRAAGLQPSFEISRETSGGIAYLVAYDDRQPLTLDGQRSVTVAEILVDARNAVTLEVDPALTMLVDRDGRHSASVGNGGLTVNGISVETETRPRTERFNQ